MENSELGEIDKGTPGKAAVVVTILGGVIVMLLTLSWFGHTASASGPNAEPFVREQEGVKDFSQFHHDNPNHARLPCLLCHRREDNSAKPTLPGKGGHTPCTGCHQQQFNNSASPICLICHTDPQSGAMKPFPPLRSFNVKFAHAQHTALGASCSTCHRANRNGVALSIPSRLNAHTVCFSCHTEKAESNGRNIASCATCHVPGSFKRSSQGSVAFRMGFSHRKHDSSENLRCTECHKVRGGTSPNDVSSPVALNHHASWRVTSCKSCHNGKKAFGGDDFSVCTRCHTGARWKF